MRERKAIGVMLLFAALILLNTCQLQFNKSAGNNVALRVVVPGGASGGGKSASGSKSLAFGASLAVTFKQGTTTITQQTIPLNGGTSVDFSFSLSSSGTYDVTALMQDANGFTIAQNTTKLTVPSGNYPVVLTLDSSLLSNAVLTDNTGTTQPFSPPFSPTTYSFTTSFYYSPPLTLTLTALDPSATITVTQNGTVISPSGSDYTGLTTLYPVIIVVAAADGTSSLTYTYSPNGG